MHEDRRFSFEEAHKLDDPRRRELQPVGPVVERIASEHPGIVVDLGAGTGYFALPLAERLSSARIVAVDVEPRMLRLLRERAETAGLSARIEEVTASVDTGLLPIEPGSADVVLMANLYHELGDRRTGLTRSRSVLRKGGTLVICDWDPDAASGAGPPRDHRIGPGIVETELAEAEFGEITRHEGYRDLYLISARK